MISSLFRRKTGSQTAQASASEEELRHMLLKHNLNVLKENWTQDVLTPGVGRNANNVTLAADDATSSGLDGLNLAGIIPAGGNGLPSGSGPAGSEKVDFPTLSGHLGSTSTVHPGSTSTINPASTSTSQASMPPVKPQPTGIGLSNFLRKQLAGKSEKKTMKGSHSTGSVLNKNVLGVRVEIENPNGTKKTSILEETNDVDRILLSHLYRSLLYENVNAASSGMSRQHNTTSMTGLNRKNSSSSVYAQGTALLHKIDMSGRRGSLHQRAPDMREQQVLAYLQAIVLEKQCREGGGNLEQILMERRMLTTNGNPGQLKKSSSFRDASAKSLQTGSNKSLDKGNQINDLTNDSRSKPGDGATPSSAFHTLATLSDDESAKSPIVRKKAKQRQGQLYAYCLACGNFHGIEGITGSRVWYCTVCASDFVQIMTRYDYVRARIQRIEQGSGVFEVQGGGSNPNLNALGPNGFSPNAAANGDPGVEVKVGTLNTGGIRLPNGGVAPAVNLAPRSSRDILQQLSDGNLSGGNQQTHNLSASARRITGLEPPTVHRTAISFLAKLQPFTLADLILRQETDSNATKKKSSDGRTSETTPLGPPSGTPITGGTSSAFVARSVTGGGTTPGDTSSAAGSARLTRMKNPRQSGSSTHSNLSSAKLSSLYRGGSFAGSASGTGPIVVTGSTRGKPEPRTKQKIPRSVFTQHDRTTTKESDARISPPKAEARESPPKVKQGDRKNDDKRNSKASVQANGQNTLQTLTQVDNPLRISPLDYVLRSHERSPTEQSVETGTVRRDSVQDPSACSSNRNSILTAMEKGTVIDMPDESHDGGHHDDVTADGAMADGSSQRDSARPSIASTSNYPRLGHSLTSSVEPVGLLNILKQKRDASLMQKRRGTDIAEESVLTEAENESVAEDDDAEYKKLFAADNKLPAGGADGQDVVVGNTKRSPPHPGTASANINAAKDTNSALKIQKSVSVGHGPTRGIHRPSAGPKNNVPVRSSSSFMKSVTVDITKNVIAAIDTTFDSKTTRFSLKRNERGPKANGIDKLGNQTEKNTGVRDDTSTIAPDIMSETASHIAARDEMLNGPTKALEGTIATDDDEDEITALSLVKPPEQIPRSNIQKSELEGYDCGVTIVEEEDVEEKPPRNPPSTVGENAKASSNKAQGSRPITPCTLASSTRNNGVSSKAQSKNSKTNVESKDSKTSYWKDNGRTIEPNHPGGTTSFDEEDEFVNWFPDVIDCCNTHHKNVVYGYFHQHESNLFASSEGEQKDESKMGILKPQARQVPEPAIRADNQSPRTITGNAGVTPVKHGVAAAGTAGSGQGVVGTSTKQIANQIGRQEPIFRQGTPDKKRQEDGQGLYPNTRNSVGSSTSLIRSTAAKIDGHEKNRMSMDRGVCVTGSVSIQSEHTKVGVSDSAVSSNSVKYGALGLGKDDIVRLDQEQRQQWEEVTKTKSHSITSSMTTPIQLRTLGSQSQEGFTGSEVQGRSHGGTPASGIYRATRGASASTPPRGPRSKDRGKNSTDVSRANSKLSGASKPNETLDEVVEGDEDLYSDVSGDTFLDATCFDVNVVKKDSRSGSKIRTVAENNELKKKETTVAEADKKLRGDSAASGQKKPTTLHQDGNFTATSGQKTTTAGQTSSLSATVLAGPPATPATATKTRDNVSHPKSMAGPNPKSTPGGCSRTAKVRRNQRGKVIRDYSFSQCIICSDHVDVEDLLIQLPCQHCYHHDCILTWLSMHSTCPICRFQLPTE